MPTTSDRLTLRDLPIPAKLVVTSFLISVGLGYLWAMAQIHFKHASPGEPMPTLADLVGRFSGVPWPSEPKPEPENKDAKEEEKPLVLSRAGVKVKTIIDTRCLRCHKPGGDREETLLTNHSQVAKQLEVKAAHPKGRLVTVLTGLRGKLTSKTMVGVFFEFSEDWEELNNEQRKLEEPKREAERLVLLAWIEAGATKETFEANAFPLPQGFDRTHLANRLLVELDPAAIRMGRGGPQPVPPGEKTPRERWGDAKGRQINVEHLTQSTHAHLLSFSMLWALTGIVFAFTNYSYFLRCLISPLVLIAQVLDISCWWLARLEGVGPYFALAVLGTGGVVGLGVGAQITLSLWSIYGKKGRCVLLLLALVGVGLFGLTYQKVIKPQLEEEKKLVAPIAN